MASSNSIVTYKDIPEYPEYRIGNDGSVWSCKSRERYPKKVPWRKLKPKVNKDGHLIVTLCRPRKMFFVHTLVLVAFVGPRPKGMEACHYPDRNPANNKPSNLRWGTRKDNAADSVKHGTNPHGEKHGCARLKVDDVRSIRTSYAAGVSSKKLAEKYGINKAHVWDIVARNVWKSVT